jgi:hypothetical protein
MEHANSAMMQIMQYLQGTGKELILIDLPAQNEALMQIKAAQETLRNGIISFWNGKPEEAVAAIKDGAAQWTAAQQQRHEHMWNQIEKETFAHSGKKIVAVIGGAHQEHNATSINAKIERSHGIMNDSALDEAQIIATAGQVVPDSICFRICLEKTLQRMASKVTGQTNTMTGYANAALRRLSEEDMATISHRLGEALESKKTATLKTILSEYGIEVPESIGQLETLAW